jgi:membrane protease YdiL (CAAX protease family)
VLDPALEPQSIPVADPPRIAVSERIGALIEVILCSGFPTQLFLIVIMTAAGMRLPTPAGQWSPVFVTTLSLLDTAFVIGLILLFLRAHRERARDVFLGSRRVLREALLGMLLLPFILLMALLLLGVLLHIAPQLHNIPRNPFEDMLQTRRDAVMFGFVAMIAGGVREEVQRGFILHRFEHYLGGGGLGVVLYSALFGLGHWEQGWDAVITVGALGAVWGTIYLLRRSIIAPMISHAGFNLANLVKFFVLR